MDFAKYLTQVTKRDGHKSNPVSRFLRNFCREEDGGITIMTLLLLVSMLVMGGISVDFMRVESRRAELQNVADRAVLAAAEMEQNLDPAAVVTDYFEKAGYGDAIVGEPYVVNTLNTREVGVDAELDINMVYMRLVGMDKVTIPASSTAQEGLGMLEISLVIDVSASMRSGGSSGRVNVSGSQRGRIGDLQDAAKAFALTVLDEKYQGRVSLNIIPYGGHVNPGREMATYLQSRTASHLADVSFDLSSDFVVRGEEDTIGEMLEETDDTYLDDPDVVVDLGYVVPSHCVEFANSDWDSTGLPSFGQPLLPTFMIYGFADWELENDVRGWGWCPHDESAIKYAIQDYEDAEDYIDSIVLYDGTGTNFAVKWGLALLDPTAQPAFQYLNNRGLVPDDFANRPGAWDDGETQKVMILMTDGAITGQFRPNVYDDPDNLQNKLRNSERTLVDDRATSFTRFNNTCNLAKTGGRDVTIYTVAFETSTTNGNALKECTSHPGSTHFETSGSGLVAVFQNIAEQITELRLTR